MMRPAARPLLAAGFALAVFLIVFNATISAHNLLQISLNSHNSFRSARALHLLAEALSGIKDAETGQRGYLLTGEEAYLKPYNAALLSVAEDLRGLDAVLESQAQHRRLGTLTSKVDEKLTELKETLEMRRKGQADAAKRIVGGGRGKDIMDDIRQLVADMEAEEMSLLSVRTAESRDRLAWATLTLGIGSLAAVGLVASLGLVVSRHLASRQRSEARLREQAERWKVTLSSIGDAVIVTDDGGRVTFMNDVAEALCGWSESDAAGKPLVEVFRIVSEETRKPCEDPVAKVLRDGLVVGLANHTLLIHADGTERPIHDSAAPVKDGGGEISGVVLVFRDGSEQRLYERELVEANRRKDEFLAMLAHELRNPLAAIRTAVETINTPGAEAHTDWAKMVIGRQVGHLAHLLDDLLDVSRITRGMVRVRKQLIDAYPVINQAVESVRPLIDDRHHTLELSISREPLRLEADPVRLEQILVNLLTNAARYTPAGGRISLSAEHVGGQIVMRVADNGVGIPPETLPHIFDLFTQGERKLGRTEEGLGVGLTIVRKLLELHDGSVSARSEGRGSEFTVRLPAAERQAPALPAEQKRERRGHARILIVDDNKELAQGLSRLLKLLGHEVELAHDGPEGIEAARSYRPDVILLDIGLPNLDGYYVARLLREEGFRDTLIIAISGYGQEEDRRRSLEAGMDHHLTKPVDIRTIAELIGQAV